MFGASDLKACIVNLSYCAQNVHFKQLASTGQVIVTLIKLYIVPQSTTSTISARYSSLRDLVIAAKLTN